MRHVVAADDEIERLFESGDTETAHRAVAQLARDDAEALPVLLQAPYFVDDPFVRLYQGVVVREVVGAVGLHHRLDLFFVIGDLPELRPEWCAQALDPHVVGRRRLVAAVLRHRVAVGAQDQVDGVDDRAIEVEQEGREGHR